VVTVNNFPNELLDMPLHHSRSITPEPALPQPSFQPSFQRKLESILIFARVARHAAPSHLNQHSPTRHSSASWNPCCSAAFPVGLEHRPAAALAMEGKDQNGFQLALE
jgi:hypothetical protein